MNNNLKQAAEALQQGIVEVLKTDRLDRFAEAERLCKVGHSMLRAIGTRASDFEDSGNYKVANNYLMPDTMEVTRQRTLATSIVSQTTTDSNRAAANASEASELKTLMDVVERLPEGEQRTSVQTRVDALLASITRRATLQSDPVPDPPPSPALEDDGEPEMGLPITRTEYEARHGDAE